MLRTLSVLNLFLASVLVTHNAAAAPPQIKTAAPVIYLADNLDESQNLGWCIDTQGRGFSDKLHAHSCKPRGGDVQFSFAGGKSITSSKTVESGSIEAVAFAGKCMTLLNANNEGLAFGLLDCTVGNASQQFTYDGSTQEIHPATHPDRCVAVAESSRSAGPFMSRDLLLLPCEETASILKRWIVKTQ